MSSRRIPPFDNALSEDEKVVQSFLSIIQSKIDNKLLKPQGKEREILRDAVLFPGAVIGACVTMATFVGLRKGPRHVMNYMAKQNMIGKPLPEYHEGPILKTVGSLVDAAFASLTGFATWILLVNKKKCLEIAADIPLMEGHSHLSEMLCDDFMALHGTIDNKFWKTHTDDTVVAINEFVRNCEKRRLYQKKLKREMGLNYEEMKTIDIEVAPVWSSTIFTVEVFSSSPYIQTSAI
jgi:hypothetical protein